jgi:uncharacterized membrane protein YkoI
MKSLFPGAWPRLAACLAAVVVLLAVAVPAISDDDDHVLARELLRDGRILPLAEVIAGVKGQVPGQLLEVELENEHGVYVYELKILTPEGHVQEVEANAATGKILKVEDDD